MPEVPIRAPILGSRPPAMTTPEGGYFSGPGTDPGYYEPPRPHLPPNLGPPMPRDGDPEPIGGMVGRPSVGAPPARRPVMGGPGFQPPVEAVPEPIFNPPPGIPRGELPPVRQPVMGGPGFQPEPEPIPIYHFPQPPRGGLPPVRQPVMGGPGYQPGRIPTRSPIDEMGLWELAMRRMQQYY
jgi:hypothetical protein